MKRKRSSKSLAGKTSLRGTGCLSASQAKKVKAHKISDLDWREMRWGERLKLEMARAEAYFWRQTPERRAIHAQYLKGKTWKNHNFCFAGG